MLSTPRPAPPLASIAAAATPTSARFAPTTTSPTPPPARPWDAMLESLRGRPVLVAQMDSRMSDALRGAAPTNPANFSEAYTHTCVLGIQLWAEAQGMGYALFSSPKSPAPPHPGLRVGGYWFKVHGVFYALHVARAAGVPYVLFLDSDVMPGDLSMSINRTVVEAFRARPELDGAVPHIVNVPDHDHWSRMLHWTHTYNERAINSGVIALRVTERAEELVSEWWFNLTTQRSPLEYRWTSTWWEVPARAEAANASDSVHAVLAAALGTTQFRVQLDRLDAARTKLVFRPDELGLNVSRYYDWLLPTCCETPVCVRALVPSYAGSNPSCSIRWLNTLEQWSGDQDRLNWLHSMRPRDFAIDDRLAVGCVRLNHNVRNMLVRHLCYGHEVRSSWARRNSLLVMRQVGFGAAPGEAPTDALPEHEFWGRAERWSRDGWAVFADRMRWFELPGYAETWPVERVLREVVATGSVLVHNFPAQRGAG